MSTQTPREQFVRQLTECQQNLYAYILSLVQDVDRAQDVLQETNLVLWRKAEQGPAIENFLAWAIEVSRYQVMAHLRDRGRDRHLYQPALLELLAADAADRLDGLDDRRRALQKCLGKLTQSQRELIHRRYARNEKVQDIAEHMRRPAGVVAQTFYRIRKSLLSCIERTLGTRSGAADA
jgi:RNA polymerase sigma-70 factor (ECF subfamily)